MHQINTVIREQNQGGLLVINHPARFKAFNLRVTSAFCLVNLASRPVSPKRLRASCRLVSGTSLPHSDLKGSPGTGQGWKKLTGCSEQWPVGFQSEAFTCHVTYNRPFSC